MVTGRTRLFLASGAMAALGLLANACGTTSESSTTTSTIADPPASTSPSTQATTTSTELPDGVTVHLAFSAGDGSDCSEVAAVPRFVEASVDPMTGCLRPPRRRSDRRRGQWRSVVLVLGGHGRIRHDRRLSTVVSSPSTSRLPQRPQQRVDDLWKRGPPCSTQRHRLPVRRRLHASPTRSTAVAKRSSTGSNATARCWPGSRARLRGSSSQSPLRCAPAWRPVLAPLPLRRRDEDGSMSPSPISHRRMCRIALPGPGLCW